MITQTLADPTGFLPFLKESVEVALRDPHPNLYLTAIPYTLTFVLDRDPEREDFFQFFVKSCEICHEYYTLHPSFTELNYREAAPQAKYLGPYILYQYQRSGTVRSVWLEQRLKAALDNNNLGFFDYLLRNEIPLVAIELHRPQVALELLGLFIKEALQKPALSILVQGFLARLRIYYPDEVDDFMEERYIEEKFKFFVKTNPPGEKVGQLVGGIRVWRFFINDMLNGSPELKPQFIDLMSRAAEYRSARSWLEYLARYFINAVYGYPVLRPAGSKD